MIYLTHTRTHIAFSIGIISRFMQNPTKQHFEAAKGVLLYVVGTIDYEIWYTEVSNFNIFEFTDSD